MNFPNFHDGFFDGLRIGRLKGVVDFFLRTADDNAFTLTLHGVKWMNLSDVWEGNIIFDPLFRDTNSITLADLEEPIHGGPLAQDEGATLLTSIQEQKLTYLEMNTSYGAHGSVLFIRYEIVESSK